MQDWTPREHYTAEDLVEIIRILRDRDTGCPWDKVQTHACLLYTSPSPRDRQKSRMPSSA